MESAKVSPEGQRRAVMFRYLEAADAAKASRCGTAADWASDSSTVAAEDDLPVHQKSRELLESRHIVSSSIWMAAQQGTPKSKGSSTPTSATSATPRCCSSSALDSSFAAEDDMPVHQKSVERLEMRHIVSTSIWVAAQQGPSSSKLRRGGSQSEESADLSGLARSDVPERDGTDPPHALLVQEEDAKEQPGSLEEEKFADAVTAPGAVDQLTQDDERSTICAEEPDAISKPGSASSDSLPACTDSLPVARLYDSPLGCTIEVHYYAATGPHGQVVLDTVFMELLALAKWRGINLRLHPSSYASLPSFGELPVAFGGDLQRVEHRDRVLTALRELGGCASDGQGHLGSVADLRELMERDIAGPVSELLWRDATVYEEYTWPVLLASSPAGFGRYWAWAERRRQVQKLLPGEADAGSAFGRLAGVLDTLAAHLGDGHSFQPEADAMTLLDLSAFAHLAVLFGIICKQGSQLKRVLTKHSNLASFCTRLQEQLGAWPCAGTFLAGLDA